MEEQVKAIRELLGRIVDTVAEYDEPGGRLILAAQAYQMINQASIDLGAYG